MEATGVLKNAVLVFGQMNEPLGARFQVGDAALTMVEYFRERSQPAVMFSFCGSGKESIHSSTRLLIVLSDGADNRSNLKSNACQPNI
jgi:hypothetical protein